MLTSHAITTCVCIRLVWLADCTDISYPRVEDRILSSVKNMHHLNVLEDIVLAKPLFADLTGIVCTIKCEFATMKDVFNACLKDICVSRVMLVFADLWARQVFFQLLDL